MKERPIIFSCPMVRAILEGRKTQTRRIVKPQPIARRHAENNGVDGDLIFSFDGGLMKLRTSRGRNAGAAGIMVETPYPCPYGVPGDRLWCKETWQEHDGRVCYKAGVPPFTHYCCQFVGHLWRPSIHMPRRLSRITLEIESVRVERLQEISEADAMAEGITDGGCLNCGKSEPCGCSNPEPDARESFAWLWQSIHGSDSWNTNPWVWVLTFKKV